LGQPGQPDFAVGGEQVQQTHHDMPRAAGGAFGAGNQQAQQTNQRMPKPVGGGFVPGNQQVQQTHHSSQNQATSYRAPLAGRCRSDILQFLMFLPFFLITLHSYIAEHPSMLLPHHRSKLI